MGARMLAASANLVAKVHARDTPTPPSGQASAPTASAPPTPHKPSSTTASQLAAKQHLLEQQITEQKTLMAKLSSATPEQKKEIMARLRKLNEEMKPSPSAPAPAKDASPAPAKRSQGGSPRSEDQLRERLDKELELHHATTAAEGEGETEVEESTEELKARLEKLKAEVRFDFGHGGFLAADCMRTGSKSWYHRWRSREHVALQWWISTISWAGPRTRPRILWSRRATAREHEARQPPEEASRQGRNCGATPSSA